MVWASEARAIKKGKMTLLQIQQLRHLRGPWALFYRHVGPSLDWEVDRGSVSALLRQLKTSEGAGRRCIQYGCRFCNRWNMSCQNILKPVNKLIITGAVKMTWPWPVPGELQHTCLEVSRESEDFISWFRCLISVRDQLCRSGCLRTLFSFYTLIMGCSEILFLYIIVLCVVRSRMCALLTQLHFF